MKIQITDEMKSKARQLAEEFTKLNVPGKEKHIFKTEDNFENKRIGFIGEIAFAKYLDEMQIEYETDDVLFRKDNFDFKIQNKTFDVKTTKLMVYKNKGILINETQARNLKCDYVCHY